MLKPAARLQVLLVGADDERAAAIAAALRANGSAVRLQRADTVGDVNVEGDALDLCLISLSGRQSLADAGVDRLRERGVDGPILALGEPAAPCSYGQVLAHGFADWVDVDDPLHLSQVALREGERLNAIRRTRLLRAALLDSEQRAEQVMQDAREPHAVIIGGAHASTNHSYRRLLGLDGRAAAEATPLLDLVDAADRERMRELLAAFARPGGARHECALRLRRTDALVLHARLSLSPWVGEGEHGLLLTVRSLAQPAPSADDTLPVALADRDPGDSASRAAAAPATPPAPRPSAERVAALAGDSGATRRALDAAMRKNALVVALSPLQARDGAAGRHWRVGVQPRDSQSRLPSDAALLRLAAAEKTTQNLDRWLLFSATREAARSAAGGCLHLPLSARSLVDTSLPSWMRQLLGQLEPSELRLALWLHAADCRAATEGARALIEALKPCGCRFTLGAAFRSREDLALLQTLGPDYVELHPGVWQSHADGKLDTQQMRQLIDLIGDNGANAVAIEACEAMPAADVVHALGLPLAPPAAPAARPGSHAVRA